MENNELKALLERYRNGSSTPEDKAFLESWYLTHNQSAPYVMPDDDRNEDVDRIWAMIQKNQSSKKKNNLSYSLAIAASILIFVAIGGYFLVRSKSKVPTNIIVKNEIAPGKNDATLTLGNGKKISLTNTVNGVIMQQSGIKVIKSKNGQLIYKVLNAVEFTADNKKNINWNTITTPMGGQWQIILPDNSKVWLNSASSLKYPEHFEGNTRNVELKGEAYFEVFHNEKMPFHVKCDRQDVEVLGTHFNISAYSDDANIKTTLLEGSVKVSQPDKNITKLLKPGQEAVLSDIGINVTNVDADDAIAWKDGIFLFNDDHLDEIMKKISRWYNVDVEFKDEVLKKEMFSGTVSRFAQVSQVLRKLEALGGVSFRMEPHKIIVMRK
ncbi:FecR family protein [Mucilaginibacter sp. OK098]|uniref:FecR family protein n=1 Tax=Mucilaginibacter sp. OK098 TaxID=1855297 RepID=UPI00090FEACD|nr:FecR domain-containing protein [Mucilaginibacter sp. OK098]SHM77875.1 FecR family protein [Mucilaginibacter sp. OK098]